MAKITIKRDGEGYLAEVVGRKNIYAYGFTPQEAESELLNVIEMIMDYHLEQVEKERKIRSQLLSGKHISYAI